MNLPIFDAVLRDENDGIQCISLVELPAVESDFIAFARDEEPMVFSLNDEKQIITGVVMRADYPIIRNDAKRGKYYVRFSKDVIKLASEKMLMDNTQNRVNQNHQPNSDVKGVEMFELFIKDTEKGINPKGFEDIADGSLFASYQVYNKDVWNKIKAGDYKGFSIEGWFGWEAEIDVDAPDEELDQILSLLEELYNRTHKN